MLIQFHPFSPRGWQDLPLRPGDRPPLSQDVVELRKVLGRSQEAAESLTVGRSAEPKA